MNELKPCPVCGAKAFIQRDVVGGFDFGISVGCPRYCRDDGIHGISTYEEHIERGYVAHHFSDRKIAIDWWNRRIEQHRREGGE